MATTSTGYGGAFKVVRENVRLQDISCNATELVHVKTGARVLKLVHDDDDNKVFTISFGTTPTDSTGCPHIAEHSVLCGSRKFRTKQPFVDMMKGSLNTFLNAFTYPDKTMYPVASRNHKDFRNLVDVYLDAVFHPRIHTSKNVFLQEGWRYHIENPNDPITINGVVYNEMKGDYSSPDELLSRLLLNGLFPHSAYAFDFGGDPNDIPTLKWEQFLEFHTKNYHPSNSYTILYGDGNLEEELAILESYFSEYSPVTPQPCISDHPPFSSVPPPILAEYPIGINEDPSEKTILALAWQIGHTWDMETYLSMSILDFILTSTEGAIVKEVLIKRGVGKDVYGIEDFDMKQPMLAIVLRGTEATKLEEFISAIHNVLETAVREGIPSDMIEGAINLMEFQLREADYKDYPKGLVHAMSCMQSWLYGQDPLALLEYSSALRDIRKAALPGSNGAKGRYFETMIERHLLQNMHRCIVCLKPSCGLEERRKQELESRLKAYKASLTSNEIEQLVNQTQAMLAEQRAPDTPEALATIPTLLLSDVDPHTERIPHVITTVGEGVPMLQTLAKTNGILYCRFLFDITWVPLEQLPLLALLCDLIGKVDTVHHNYVAVSNQINMHSGGVSLSQSLYIQQYQNNAFSAVVTLKCSLLLSKIEIVMRLLSELLLGTIFTSHDRILEIVQEMKMNLEDELQSCDSNTVFSGVLSYLAPGHNFEYHYSGLHLYKWLAELEKSWSEETASRLEHELASLSSVLFDRGRLIVSCTCEPETVPVVVQSVALLLSQLPCKVSGKLPVIIGNKPNECSTRISQSDEGLIISSSVNCVAKAVNIAPFGLKFNGAFQVCCKYLELEFLWPKIRDQGGAYGCWAYFKRDGSIALVSYHDPNVSKTIQVYDETAGFVSNLHLTPESLAKYIIGTIGEEDSPMTPSMKGEFITRTFMVGLTLDDVQRERDEMLGTTPDQIVAFTERFQLLAQQGHVCAIGPTSCLEPALKATLLKRLVNVFEQKADDEDEDEEDEEGGEENEEDTSDHE